mmetsp:Transcript_10975/g.12405  ORF Transcript_10975/g.12405 Transcript_10975/m.12405 type:complete len:118 (-) Transcript_10975:406-759(-)|eukprot:CAMPEP_0170781254 /NCGR_PEP_ID=MMETSP0733-20121128/14090_1 /TAXON_ID=186038 /ORGANISM="Fragilariopsis kerguelensis, Strain L26-C5" /LENGTH=117 /DNA_ID=CAMNT_0011125259 /DNA_START=44 /DNA_END=397 /DNA_ORIENTATION=-
MIEIAALLLCKLGGKDGSAADIKAVIEAAGAEVDADKVSTLTGDMEGKNIDELLKTGLEKMKDVPMGGGGGGGGGGSGGAGDAAAEEVVEEEEEEEEAEAPAGGGGLFGGDEGGGDY